MIPSSPDVRCFSFHNSRFLGCRPWPVCLCGFHWDRVPLRLVLMRSTFVPLCDPIILLCHVSGESECFTVTRKRDKGVFFMSVILSRAIPELLLTLQQNKAQRSHTAKHRPLLVVTPQCTHGDAGRSNSFKCSHTNDLGTFCPWKVIYRIQIQIGFFVFFLWHF